MNWHTAAILGLCVAAILAAGRLCVFCRHRQPSFIAPLRKHLATQAALVRRCRREHGGPAPNIYLVIGAPGAGKTTLLHNSGISFLASPGQSRDDAAWWVAEKAVFIELPGRYVEAGKACAERRWLLKWLCRRSKSLPLRGIVLAVHAADVDAAGQGPGWAGATLQQMGHELGFRPPVYMVVTHCDDVPGFHEAFAGLPDTQRKQPWGFHLPASAAESACLEQVCAEHLGELAQALRVHTTLQLHGHKRNLRAIAPVFQFPQRFWLLSQSITRWVQAWAYLPRITQPFLRGVYLVAGAPTAMQPGHLAQVASLTAGSWLDLVPATEARHSAHPGSGAFFIEEFFSQLRNDRHASCLPVPTEGWRRLWGMHRDAFIAVSLLSVFATVQVISFTNNWRQVRAAETWAERNVEEAAQLAALRRQTEEVSSYARQSISLSHGWGLNQMPALQPALAAHYARSVESAIINDVLRDDLRVLHQFAERFDGTENSPPIGDQHGSYFSRLKLHLLISRPHESEEPKLAGDTIHWAAERLSQAWLVQSATMPTPEQRQDVYAHVRSYVDLLAEDPPLAQKRDQAMVAQVRQILRRTPSVPQALVDAFVADYPDDPMGLQQLMLGRTMPFTGCTPVPLALTRQGWEQGARSWLDRQKKQTDAWVLQRLGDKRASNVAEPMRVAYELKYIDAWQRFLTTCRAARAHDLIDAETWIDAMTLGTPVPIKAFFAAFAEQTHLGRGTLMEQVSQKAEKLMGTAGTDPVKHAFKEFVGVGVAEKPEGHTPLDSYVDALQDLRSELAQLKQDSTRTDAVVEKLRKAQDTARGIIASVGDATLRRVLAALLSEPLDPISSLLMRGTRQHIADAWRNEIYTGFADTFAGRYPFVADAPSAARLSDVKAYFARDGVLWSFYDTHLKNDVQRAGNQFRVRDGRAMRNLYSSALPLFLRRAQAVTDSLFQHDGRMEIPMELALEAPAQVQQVTLTVGSRTITAQGGTTSGYATVVWPDPELAKGGAQLVAVGGGKHDAKYYNYDDWGLFHLLESGKWSSDGLGERFTVSWPLKYFHGQWVSLHVRLPTRNNPFLGPERHHWDGLFKPLSDVRAGPNKSLY